MGAPQGEGGGEGGLTELAALADEARPAGALAADVVTVGPVLAAAHLGAVGTVEAGRAT